MVKKICKINSSPLAGWPVGRRGGLIYCILSLKHEQLFMLHLLFPAVCSTPARKKIIEQSKLCAGGTTAHPDYTGQ